MHKLIIGLPYDVVAGARIITGLDIVCCCNFCYIKDTSKADEVRKKILLELSR